LAETSFRIEDYPRAVQLNEQLLQQAGYDQTDEYPATLYNLAYALYSQQRYDQAEPWFKQYLSLAPSKRQFTADAQTRLADCYFIMRDYERSAEL
jgi:TolA-binding protein